MYIKIEIQDITSSNKKKLFLKKDSINAISMGKNELHVVAHQDDGRIDFEFDDKLKALNTYNAFLTVLSGDNNITLIPEVGFVESKG